MAVAEVTPDLMARYKIKAPKGVVVRKVKPHSPAADAGLEEGDVILQANGKTLTSPEEFKEVVKSSNGKIGIHVARGDDEIFLTLSPSKTGLLR